MTAAATKYDQFLALHHAASPLLLPNAWDAGSAKVFAFLGFSAFATTSAGHAATLGRRDGTVTLDQIVGHATDLAGAADIPLNVDFENGFADTPEGVAANVTRIVATGAAGCSIEDYDRNAKTVYPLDEAVARLEAAVIAAHGSGPRVVITARAENFLRGNPDLEDTIARLQAYQAAGADVLYAPGAQSIDDIRAITSSVDLPVNVLALPGTANVTELGEAGVKRISVGSGFASVALGAAVDAAREFLEQGTYGWWSVAASAGGVGDAFR